MTNQTPQPNDEVLDLNGNPLPMPIRVLRATGFGMIGTLILLSGYFGADTTLAKFQVIFGAAGAGMAYAVMKVTQWRKSASPAVRLAWFVFFGSLIGTVIATALFGGQSVSDDIARGLGSGVFHGVMTSLGVNALRSAFLSLSK